MNGEKIRRGRVIYVETRRSMSLGFGTLVVIERIDVDQVVV